MAPDSESDGNARGGWDQYRMLIVTELKRLSHEVGALRDQLADFRNEERDTREREMNLLKLEVAMLKVKSGLWGAAAGALILCTALLLRFWHV